MSCLSLRRLPSCADGDVVYEISSWIPIRSEFYSWVLILAYVNQLCMRTCTEEEKEIHESIETILQTNYYTEEDLSYLTQTLLFILIG